MKPEQLFGVVALAMLSWGAFQLYVINASMAVVTYKVDENYNMIKPMWEDFLVRRNRVAER